MPGNGTVADPEIWNPWCEGKGGVWGGIFLPKIFFKF